ncbi:MAG TPA: plastocyanin/azurin family copper-binding protein [Longimicrobiaceae bacterium]|nr:plastocyanin/azurin family copper-binding protein [Longimicrobiaceae bacterium]
MPTFNRNFLVRLPVLGLLAFAAACGGSDQAAKENADVAANEGATAETTTEQAPSAPATAGNVITVQMKTTNGGASGVFEPAQITARKGDVIRFVNDGGAAHNANFNTPANAGKSNLPAPTPYATGAGQTVDVQVTMDAGTYEFQCDPHAAMGMKGTLTVTQ